jgi:hypothetical protein
MSGGNRLPMAWAHSDYSTAPCTTRRGIFGRDDVRTCDSLGGRKLVVNLTGLQ